MSSCCPACDEHARRLDALLRMPPRSVEVSVRLTYLRATLAELREAGCSAREQRALLGPDVLALTRSDAIDEERREQLRGWLAQECPTPAAHAPPPAPGARAGSAGA